MIFINEIILILKLIFFKTLINMSNSYYTISITDVNKTKTLIDTLKYLKEDNHIKLSFTCEGINFNFLTKYLTTSLHVNVLLEDNDIPEDIVLEYIIDPTKLYKFLMKRRKSDNLLFLLHKKNKSNLILYEQILDSENYKITKIKNHKSICSFGDFCLKDNMKIIEERVKGEMKIKLDYFSKIISDIIKDEESEFNLNNERIMISTENNSIVINNDDKYLIDYDIESNIIFLTQNTLLKNVLKPLKKVYKDVSIEFYEKRITLILESEYGNITINNSIKSIV